MKVSKSGCAGPEAALGMRGARPPVGRASKSVQKRPEFGRASRSPSPRSRNVGTGKECGSGTTAEWFGYDSRVVRVR
eukprot:1229659-Pyramimonas_sp.AAC.1